VVGIFRGWLISAGFSNDFRFFTRLAKLFRRGQPAYPGAPGFAGTRADDFAVAQARLSELIIFLPQIFLPSSSFECFVVRRNFSLFTFHGIAVSGPQDPSRGCVAEHTIFREFFQ
jgi:hypothetical protein